MYSKSIEKIELKYKVVGDSGPLLFFMHGFGGSPQNWAELVPLFAQNFRCVVPNLKIFFTSEKPLSFRKQLKILRIFIEKVSADLNCHTLYIVSASYGATLSAVVSKQLADKVEACIFISPMPLNPLSRLRHRPLKWIMELAKIPIVLKAFLNSRLGYGVLTYVGRAFHIRMTKKSGFRRFNARKIKIVFNAIKRFIWISDRANWGLWHKKLLDFNVPSLVIYGTQDRLFLPDDFEAFALNVNTKNILPISSKSHFLMVTEPRAILNSSQQFLLAYSDPLAKEVV